MPLLIEILLVLALLGIIAASTAATVFFIRKSRPQPVTPKPLVFLEHPVLVPEDPKLAAPVKVELNEVLEDPTIVSSADEADTKVIPGLAEEHNAFQENEELTRKMDAGETAEPLGEESENTTGKRQKGENLVTLVFNYLIANIARYKQVWHAEDFVGNPLDIPASIATLPKFEDRVARYTFFLTDVNAYGPAWLYINLLRLMGGPDAAPTVSAFRHLLRAHVCQKKSNRVRRVRYAKFGLALHWITKHVRELEKAALTNPANGNKTVLPTGGGGPRLVQADANAPMPVGPPVPLNTGGGGSADPEPKNYREVPSDLNFDESVTDHIDKCWRARGTALRFNQGDPVFHHKATSFTYTVVRMIYVAVTGMQPIGNMSAGCGLTGDFRQGCVNPFQHDPANGWIPVTIDEEPHPVTLPRRPRGFTRPPMAAAVGAGPRRTSGVGVCYHSTEPPLPAQDYLELDCNRIKSDLFSHRGAWNSGKTIEDISIMMCMPSERVRLALIELGPAKGARLWEDIDTGKWYPRDYRPR